MGAFRIPGASQRRHDLALLADTPVHQHLPRITPTVSPTRLRGLAEGRLRDARAMRRHLRPVDDLAQRTARAKIVQLEREAADFTAQADALERSRA